MTKTEYRRLVKATVLVADETLSKWQEAFGAEMVEPREASGVIDALLDLRIAAVELVRTPST